MAFSRAFQCRALGYLRGGASGDREAVLRLWIGALGQRRARRGPHAAIPAGVAVVPVQIRAGRAAGASADDAAATGGVCGAERAGDATGKPASGGLDQDFGDVSGSGGGGIHVHSEASELCVGGIGAEGR